MRLMIPHCTPQPSICKLSWCPQLEAKGCHAGGDGHLQNLWNSWGGSLWYQFNLLNHRSGDFRCSSFGLLMGVALKWWQLEHGGDFWVGWDGGHGRMRYGSSQEPIQTLCLQSCHWQFNFCSPSVSNHCASSLSELTLLNKSRPWKREKWVLSLRSDLYTGPWKE